MIMDDADVGVPGDVLIPGDFRVGDLDDFLKFAGDFRLIRLAGLILVGD